MRTNYIPAIVTLLAGAVYCLFGIYTGVSLFNFTVQLLIVLVIFFILGTVVRVVFESVISGVEVQTKNESEIENISETVKETNETKETENTEEPSEEEGM